MVRTQPAQAATGLDSSRILATSFALAMHALALLVLLLPLTQASLPDLRPEPAPERWKVERVLPVVPLPPKPVEQPRTPAPPRPQPAAVHTPTPVSSPVIVDQGNLAADPVPGITGPADITPPLDASPLSGAALRYAVAPPPPYPRDALRAGAQGTVLLRVLVDTDGKPLQVVLERSSGHRSLDREAVRQVQARWRFEPALRDGRPVQAWGLVPIGFSLQ